MELLLPEPPLVELPEPVLMTRCTVLPGSSWLPPVGVWLMTLPDETELLGWYSVVTLKSALLSVVMALLSDWPTTLGTLTALLSLPFDTTMLTVPSALSLLPLDGVWLMTTPSSTVSEYCGSTVT